MLHAIKAAASDAPVIDRRSRIIGKALPFVPLMDARCGPPFRELMQFSVDHHRQGASRDKA
jgi:hypothetical protein